MKLSLFDLHCDTAYKMLTERQFLTQNKLAVSLENTRKFDRYVQVMALWTDDSLDDEQGWQQMLAMHKNLLSDPAVQNKKVMISSTLIDTTSPLLLLSIEDLRILAGRLERVDELFRLGIRIITPLWRGDTCIGGSHDTTNGLTEFGKRALHRAISLGMIADISHASIRAADEILSLGKALNRPVIASHSNAYEICPVSRNLIRRQAVEIIDMGGLIGLNLHAPFLKHESSAVVEDLFPHIDYFLELGAFDTLCLGCDLDGCQPPTDSFTVASLIDLAEMMLKRNYSESLIQRIFYENAAHFASAL